VGNLKNVLHTMVDITTKMFLFGVAGQRYSIGCFVGNYLAFKWVNNQTCVLSRSLMAVKITKRLSNQRLSMLDK